MDVPGEETGVSAGFVEACSEVIGFSGLKARVLQEHELRTWREMP